MDMEMEGMCLSRCCTKSKRFSQRAEEEILLRKLMVMTTQKSEFYSFLRKKLLTLKNFEGEGARNNGISGETRSNLYQKGKELVEQGNLVEEVNERLKILEEEYEVMKRIFTEIVEERERLLDEIYKRLWIIQHCRRRLEEQGIREISFPCDQIARGSGAGLSQVLYEDANPCTVTREHKAWMLR